MDKTNNNINELINMICENIFDIAKNGDIENIDKETYKEDMKKHIFDIVNNISFTNKENNDDIKEIDDNNNEKIKEDFDFETINETIENLDKIKNSLNEYRKLLIEFANEFLNNEICQPYTPETYVSFLNMIIKKIILGIEIDKEKLVLKVNYYKKNHYYKDYKENHIEENNIKEETNIKEKDNNIKITNYKYSYTYYFDDDKDKEFPFKILLSLNDSDCDKKFHIIITGFNNLLKIEDNINNFNIDKNIIESSIIKNTAILYKHVYDNHDNIEEEYLNKFIESKIAEFASAYCFMRDDGFDIKEINVNIPPYSIVYISSRYTFKIERYINIATEIKKYIISDNNKCNNERIITIESKNDLNENDLRSYIYEAFIF